MTNYMDDLKALKPIFWENTHMYSANQALSKIQYTLAHVIEAEERLNRFASYFMKTYPETQQTKGLIESSIHECVSLNQGIFDTFGREIKNPLMLKLDNQLPISGSVKARGGVYEVIKLAETLAIQHGLLSYEDDYAILAGDKFREFFGHYSIAVGSTGNLGLSIGIAGEALGFKVQVHMSSEAKAWKKDLLRSKGVEVIEYNEDYSTAVKYGRQQAQSNPKMHFIDDENSIELFLGYAIAALRLKKQMAMKGHVIDANHKLKVYLPCGIGGAPGGITFGLKLVFGDDVECYMAEPTHAPCMTLGLMTGKHDAISIYDIGVDGKTEADGLAVARASKFVGKTIEHLVSGCYTVTDNQMFQMLYLLEREEGIRVEPSAAASLMGPLMVQEDMPCVHLAWLTGGAMVPKEMMDAYIRRGKC